MNISPRDVDAGGKDGKYVVREPVDGYEVDSVNICLIGMGSINAERASLGETQLDDLQTEPIRSDSD